jgi:nucleoid-associated protein YgaU
VTDTLNPGQQLHKGDSITSNNGAYTLTLQDDGNLVLGVWGQALWATGTDGKDVERADLQTDGNFVLYSSSGAAVWETNTDKKPNTRLVLQDDRNLVLYSNEAAAWASATETSDPPPPAPEPEAAPVEEAAAEAPAPEPEAPPPPPPPPPAPEPRTYTVVSGDTLWAISERFYGDGSQYQRIASASGINNPDLIHPGQVLTIP